VNSAIINMGFQVSLLYADFDSSGYVPGRGTAGPEIFTFFFEN
jgi:hypothetical protein